MYYYVYQITNLVNNKIYVGKRKSVKHPSEDRYYGSGKQILAAIKKYGLENFRKEVLYYCNDLAELATVEKKIVTEEFIKRLDTYNMHKGGYGGFEHINNDLIKRAEVNNLLRKRNKELGIGGSKHWTIEGRKRIVAAAKKNSSMISKLSKTPRAIQKRKDTYLKINHQVGSNNSQFGRIWISNVLTKQTKRININDIIPHGWVRGKKGHVPKKIWVNNGIKEHYILIGKIESFKENGFNCGRLLTSMPQNRIVV